MEHGVCALIVIENGMKRVYHLDETSAAERKQIERFVENITESALVFWEDLE